MFEREFGASDVAREVTCYLNDQSIIGDFFSVKLTNQEHRSVTLDAKHVTVVSAQDGVVDLSVDVTVVVVVRRCGNDEQTLVFVLFDLSSEGRLLEARGVVVDVFDVELHRNYCRPEVVCVIARHHHQVDHSTVPVVHDRLVCVNHTWCNKKHKIQHLWWLLAMFWM